MNAKNRKYMSYIVVVFLVCELVKDLEFLLLKTDRTFLAENIFSKLFILLLLAGCLGELKLRFSSIGFKWKRMLSGTVKGLLLGCLILAVSYGTEMLILLLQGHRPQLVLSISGYNTDKMEVTGLSLAAVVICVLGNIVNVVAEEGLFRGFLMQLGRKVMPVKRMNLLQALLFGLWHIVLVISLAADGVLTASAVLPLAVGYVFLSGLFGYGLGRLAITSGSLWMGAGYHFMNNFTGNILHVLTDNGTDELQTVRTILATVLFVASVMAFAGRRRRSVSRQ